MLLLTKTKDGSESEDARDRIPGGSRGRGDADPDQEAVALHGTSWMCAPRHKGR